MNNFSGNFGNNFFGKTIGILGSGQLAKMMSYSASNLGMSTIAYSNEVEPCCSEQVKKVIIASFLHEDKLMEFANQCDYITLETENIPLKTIIFLEKHFPEKIKASSQFIGIAQNRLLEKRFAQENKIPTAKNWHVKSKEEIEQVVKEFGTCILKTATEGYDGKGQAIIEQTSTIPELHFDCEYILEQKVNFICEISVIVTKSKSELMFFPIPRNVHKSGILRESVVPFLIEEKAHKEMNAIQLLAKKYTKKIADAISYSGTFAVEYFVLSSGELVFNEMAPRPHNSGHFTQDLCNVSQFENHIRAVCDMPLVHPKLLQKGRMVNIIGDDIYELEKILDKPNHKIHLYNKSQVSEGRKMGHYNIIEKNV